MNSAREIWYSLYTSELEDIWRSTEGALRKPQMICFVLTKELQKLQGNVTNENQIFIERQKSDERPASVANVPLLESNFNNNSSPIKQMPTLIPLKKEKMDVDDIIDRPTEENLFLTPSVASVNVPMVNSPAITKNSQIMSVIENTKTMVVRQKKEDKSPKFTHLLKIIPPYKSVGHETSLFNKLAPNGTQFGVETKDASAAETVADIRTKTNTTSKNNNQNIYAIKDYNESVRHETSLLNKLAPNGKQFSVETKDANVWETVADIRTKTNTTSQNDNQNIYLFKDYNESVRHETSLLNKLAPNGKQFGVETKDASAMETVADIRTKTNTTSKNNNQNIYAIKDYNEFVRHEISFFNNLEPNAKQFGIETKHASAEETVADVRTKTNTTSKNNNQNIYAIKDYNESVRHETSLFNKLAPNGKQFGVETKDASAEETVADVKMETNTTSKIDIQNIYVFKDYNEFSIVEPKSPICVQKTKPVRSRDDNMQLPGWSYKGYKKNNEKFNSLPQQLRQKMYACSQLQKKFKSLNATSKGYGDGDV